MTSLFLRAVPFRLGNPSAAFCRRILQPPTSPPTSLPLARPPPRRPLYHSSRLLREAPGKTPRLNEPADGDASNSARNKELQRPWHRVDESGPAADAASEEMPPMPRRTDAAKGRVLTTPTRLLKFILPLPIHPDQSYLNEAPPASAPDHSETETARDPKQKPVDLALLIHPQQPLSYLASLIQAELPPLRAGDASRMPAIHFRADADASSDSSTSPRPTPADVAPERKEAEWVRWSGSTEVGDFIRDAARGREFIIEIEGLKAAAARREEGRENQDAGQGTTKNKTAGGDGGDGRGGRPGEDTTTGELRVLVPSFKDRTFWMRRRLRAMSEQIDNLGKIKRECDLVAHRSAHRIAKAGFGIVGAWWVLVYYASFHTNLTWDTMEPITYLAGLVVIMAGYWYFLYVSRDLSYKAALHVTVTRRQQALYRTRGFEVEAWEKLLAEANALRGEIRVVAEEYAVEWDENKDLGGEDVREVLEEEVERTQQVGSRHKTEGKNNGSDGISKEERLEREKKEKTKTKHKEKERTGGDDDKQT